MIAPEYIQPYTTIIQPYSTKQSVHTTDTTDTTKYNLIQCIMDSNFVKKSKTTMTDKQKAARCLNLAAGRKKRMEAIKQRKEKPDEYDISSNDGSIDKLTPVTLVITMHSF